MSWTVACFCGNVYTTPPDCCEVCGRSTEPALVGSVVASQQPSTVEIVTVLETARESQPLAMRRDGTRPTSGKLVGIRAGLGAAGMSPVFRACDSVALSPCGDARP
jgi:hypothetical protein